MSKLRLKNIIITSFVFLFCLDLFSQSHNALISEYNIEKNIFYYELDTNSVDQYKKLRCRLDLYYPINDTNFATVVWFHGGGLKGGEKYFPNNLMNNKIAVVAVNYRLYPEINSPQYIIDAAASIAWVFKNIEKYGGSTKKIFVSGHSAGGYLTSMIGLDKKYLQQFGIDADSIAGLIPLSGHTITHFTIREEMGIPGEQPIINYLAPLYFVKPNSPPLILITGDRELELLGRYEENAYMWRMMKVAGNTKTELYELQGFNHGSMVEPACLLILDKIKNIIQK